MFCSNCGQKNEDEMRFCASCGTELIDNQPAVPVNSVDAAIQSAMNVPGKIKALPKIVKQLAVAVIALIVVITGASIAGSVLTNPKNIAEGFFEAKIKGEWSKMYGYLSLESSDFINKESFLKLMENEEKPEIVNYTITENFANGNGALSPDSDMVKTYAVSYVLKGSSLPQTETITLIKSSGKRLLFFADYNVNIDNLITSNYQLSAPKGSTVYIDGVKLKKTAADDDKNPDSATEAHLVPKIFSGQHELKLEHPVCETYTEKLQITGSGSNSGSSFSVSRLTLKDSVKTELADKTEEIYKKIISSALAGKSFDTLSLSCTSDSDRLEEIKDSYTTLASKVKKEDGTGYKSISVTKFTDNSSQKELNAAGTYTCDLRVEYDYVTISKNWFTEELTESAPSSRSSSVRFIFVFEDGEWVLQRLYSLGI